MGGSVPDRALYQPRYNVAPTQQDLAITNEADRPLTSLRWGLVPQWALRPAAMKLSTFNARVETIATARTYRDPTRSRRCVVVATGFYEWRKNDNDSAETPFWVQRIEGKPFAFAGLSDVWHGRVIGEGAIASCTIVTGRQTTSSRQSTPGCQSCPLMRTLEFGLRRATWQPTTPLISSFRPRMSPHGRCTPYRLASATCATMIRN